MEYNNHLFYREKSILYTSSLVAPQENALGSFFYSRDYVHIHIIFHILLRAGAQSEHFGDEVERSDFRNF